MDVKQGWIMGDTAVDRKKKKKKEVKDGGGGAWSMRRVVGDEQCEAGANGVLQRVLSTRMSHSMACCKPLFVPHQSNDDTSLYLLREKDHHHQVESNLK
ncbi:hypothetical protein GOBAR_DD31167 [Gossypium barbadense]|nr:hypothetical protein GOBAR_DD31167 [Gossypium barbadense]